jgi:phytoene dehydrogenase-like protein
MQCDVIIIGGGHNGLVAASYLAKTGLKTLVLERRELVGGISVTEEIAPGFRCSTVAHTPGPLMPRVMSDLQLERAGLELINPTVRVTTLNPDGPLLSIYEDPERTAKELERFSSADAQNYPEFERRFARIGKVLAPLLEMTPPSLDNPKPGEIWDLSKVGRAFRGLGKRDAYRVLRWGPMAVADLAAEFFDNERLRATVASRGIFGSFAGPWSAGTSTPLLWQAAHNGKAIGPASFVKGGMGALSAVLAKVALNSGAEIKTQAEVAQVRVEDNRATEVVLRDGTEIKSRAIVSSADPKTTFLNLVDPLDLDPNFISKIRNYRSAGSAAKLNLALSSLPEFVGVENAEESLSGRIQIGPDIDYLERAFDAAKYGEYSKHPFMDITIPSILDPSLAPSGAHVMSIHVQFAPYTLKNGDWNSRREEFGDHVVNELAEYAPTIKNLIVGRQLITPLDLEKTYGLNGGHLMHGEQSLDQFFTFRPLIGWAQYRTPIAGLYLCGAGTHPGGGVTGGPGANAAHEIIKDLKRRR